jgi:hypothetical protein
MREWTKRGEITPQDQDVIEAILRKNRKAGQILVVGEINTGRLEKAEEDILFASNDMLTEPLFVLTNAGTIQMARFEAKKVWPLADDALIEELVGNEAERFGLRDQLELVEFDFCRSVIQYIKIQYGEMQTPATKEKDLGAFYQTMYLSALFLLDKPGYMTVPVSRHFALQETADYFCNRKMWFRSLTSGESDALFALREKYGVFDGLSNKELQFLVRLYDAGKAV